MVLKIGEILDVAAKASKPWTCFGVVYDQKCSMCRSDGLLGHAAVGPIPTLGNHVDDLAQAEADLDYMQKISPAVVTEMANYIISLRGALSYFVRGPKDPEVARCMVEYLWPFVEFGPEAEADIRTEVGGGDRVRDYRRQVVCDDKMVQTFFKMVQTFFRAPRR